MAKKRAVKDIKVLFMDDDTRICEIMRKHFDYIGYDAVIAVSGDEAVEMYREELAAGRRFDIVVLDLAVKSGMGGVEAMRRILEIDPSAAGIITSGNYLEPAMKNFKEFGFKAAFEKPFGFEEINDKILELVKHKTADS